MNIPPDPWLTTKQAAAETAAHPETIRKACRRGEINAHKRGKIWLIRRSNLNAWIEKGAAA